MIERDIYLSIGSNIAPERHVPVALAALETAFGPLRVSALYRSAPVGFAGPDFINGVAHGRSDLPLPQLQSRFKELERAAGRNHTRKLATRELDLDLLLYGDAVIREDGIVIPRPDVLDYAFVLRPLAEIAPEKRHPQTGRTFAWHWRHFTGERIALESVSLEALTDETGQKSGRNKNGRGDRI